MIIDAHTHLGTLGRFKAGAGDLLRWADRAGIEKMITSHLGAIFYDARAGNDALGQAMRAYPQRILGYASFPSAYYGQAAIDEITRCVETYGMQGLKIYTAQRRSVAEPDMFPILAHAAALGLPILAHAVAHEIEILARELPQATLIVAHVGEGMVDANMWQMLTVARAYPNIILDLTSSQIYRGMVEACVEAAGPQRVVFGTDLPLLEPEVQIQKVYAAQIDAHTKALILGGNAARLFKLQDDMEVWQ